jgi:hypothetical protein
VGEREERGRENEERDRREREIDIVVLLDFLLQNPIIYSCMYLYLCKKRDIGDIRVDI